MAASQGWGASLRVTAAWLLRYLSIYNGRRCHMAIGGRTPFVQLQRLRVTE